MSVSLAAAVKLSTTLRTGNYLSGMPHSSYQDSRVRRISPPLHTRASCVWPATVAATSQFKTLKYLSHPGVHQTSVDTIGLKIGSSSRSGCIWRNSGFRLFLILRRFRDITRYARRDCHRATLGPSTKSTYAAVSPPGEAADTASASAGAALAAGSAGPAGRRAACAARESATPATEMHR